MDSSPTPRIDSMEPDKADIKLSKSYPLEFHYVKALFLQKHYRQCISTCRQILDIQHDEQLRHPLEQAFMRLYIALAHDDLARAMHNFSSTKLSAFDQAASLYREAAATIPGLDHCRQWMEEHGSRAKPEQRQPQPPLPESTSMSTINSEVFRRAPSPSPLLSPPTKAQTRLPEIMSPGSSNSDAEEDLESHDSFGELVAPQRLARLPSTYSSMSLLDPQKQSHGLLHPVRPGSVAKPYQAPPAVSPSPKQHRSRLPRFTTTSSLGSPEQTPARQSSPVRKQLRLSDEEWSPTESMASPVSPLGSAIIGSDDDDDEMTISPLEPSTPLDDTGEDRFPVISPFLTADKQASDPILDHIIGLRTQIGTHISLLEEARQHTRDAQAEREIKNSMRKVPASNANKLGAGTPQSRSFWLFTPENVKVMEKQRRIEEGRQRMWERPRFDPARYQGLAERALAEL